MTRLFLSTNKTSIGKRIKKVCMELHGLKISAWLGLNSFLPKRPFILLKRLLAIMASSAKIVFWVLLIIFILSLGDTLPISSKDVPRLDGKTSLGGFEDTFGERDTFYSDLFNKRRHIACGCKIS